MLAEMMSTTLVDGDTVGDRHYQGSRPNKGTAEAKIIDVLEHSIKTVVGQIVPDEKNPNMPATLSEKSKRSAS